MLFEEKCYDYTTTRGYKKRIKKQLKDRCYPVLLKTILAHLHNDSAKSKQYIANIYFRSVKGAKTKRVPRRSIDYVLIEGSLREARRR